MNEGVWFVRPGANLKPAYASKYFAFYSQNDWKVTNKLTLNLGIRWEFQPGVEERYNRAAMYDFGAMNAFGTQGAIDVPRNHSTDGHNTATLCGPPRWATLRPTWVQPGGYCLTWWPAAALELPICPATPDTTPPQRFRRGDLDLRKHGVPDLRRKSAWHSYRSDHRCRSSRPATLANYSAPQTYGVAEAYFPREHEECD